MLVSLECLLVMVMYAAVASADTCAGNSAASIFSASVTQGMRHVSASGCPGYVSNQSTGNPISVQNYRTNFPANPIISKTPTAYIGIYLHKGGTVANSAMKGPIGMALNAVTMFSNADGQNRDALTYEGSTFDVCRGHASPGGQYHYHTGPAPGCVFTDTAGSHSPMFGIMFDGVPIYGQFGVGGIAPTNLDECNGHTDSYAAFYHYHVSYPWTAYPYLINCFMGCLNGSSMISTSSTSSSTCTPAAKQYDYSSVTVTLAAASSSSSSGGSSSPPNSGTSSGGSMPPGPGGSGGSMPPAPSVASGSMPPGPSVTGGSRPPGPGVAGGSNPPAPGGGAITPPAPSSKGGSLPPKKSPSKRPPPHKTG